MFQPISSQVDFVVLEKEILEWWKTHNIASKYLVRNEQSEKRFSFIDGPITANNPMGVHHAWGRTYKDLFQRYKTMTGYRQRYQNGFDGQGLWIEVEVEKELGFRSKKDIEAYGIDRFVELCKDRVRKFSQTITDQSIRLGYWMDWDNSYHTMSDANNYTIWHFLKRCHEKGWLYEGTDVMPWCPRCGTGLSQHEIVTEGYKEVTHESVYVTFQLKDATNSHFLAWTTTPWTLSSNVSLAVNPSTTYVLVTHNNQHLYLAKNLLKVLDGPYTIEQEVLGKELVGVEYHGIFSELPVQKDVSHRVIPWNDVSDEEGTGIVHIAPGAGEEDFALGKEYSLDVIAPLDESGNFIDGFGWLTGQNVSSVNPAIFQHLEETLHMYKIETYSHRYPVCWRCDTELVFRLVNEWFISMKDLRSMIANVTRKIQWIPEFGLKRELDWLQNMDDWMISKKRYWGLALPIYRCTCGNFEVMGSKEELFSRAIEGWETFEGQTPHRPWIDQVKIACGDCGASVSRILDVGNPWLDAGIAPFSTLEYTSNREHWRDWFPADWISESFPGQFRNWFYSLLTMSTVLENTEPFQNVFSYALMRDENGNEMHKSKGNAIWFEDAAEAIGVDAMRWVFARHNPAINLNFGENITDQVKRQFFLTLWNTYSFFVTYANIDGFKPDSNIPQTDLTELDRWIISELNDLTAEVTSSLDQYQSAEATRKIEAFVEVLSNWYVRRSRRRFWKNENDTEKHAAYQTLYTSLLTVCKLMAPITPFITESIYQNLVITQSPQADQSIHLTSFPTSDPDLIDRDLSDATRMAMQIASLGRAGRSKAGIRVRQPLAKVTVLLPDNANPDLLQSVEQQILEELNIKEIQVITDSSVLYNQEVQLNAQSVGPKHGRHLPELQASLSNANHEEIGRKISNGESMILAGISLTPEDFLIRKTARAEYSITNEFDYVVAISTEIPNALYQEGLIRDLVHHVQGLRRTANFGISDRISIQYEANESIIETITLFEDYLRAETLADSIQCQEPAVAYTQAIFKVGDTSLNIGIHRN